MANLFNQFKGAKNFFKGGSPRCKTQPIARFDPDQHWSVDRWWSHEEKIELGVEERTTTMNLDRFKEKVKDTYEKIAELEKELDKLK